MGFTKDLPKRQEYARKSKCRVGLFDPRDPRSATLNVTIATSLDLGKRSRGTKSEVSTSNETESKAYVKISIKYFVLEI